MTYAKIKVTPEKAEEIRDFYRAEEIDDPRRPYDYFQVRKDGIDIKAYRNRKEVYTIVFAGSKDAVEEAELFSRDVTVSESNPAQRREEGFEDLSRQMGSDEVGVGDFFGPLVVVASYVDETDLDLLFRLRIEDSKKMKDDYILEVGELLKEKTRSYSCLLSPKKLSELVTRGQNVHKVMAILHNHAQSRLKERYRLGRDVVCYVDQFEGEDLYLRHVGSDRISNPLYFRTRGETFYPSVALSSVLARYHFLVYWKKMEEDLEAEIPKGASALVDHCYQKLCKKWPAEKVGSYVKKYFRNYQDDFSSRIIIPKGGER